MGDFPFDYVECDENIEDVARSPRVIVTLSYWRTAAAIDDGVPTLRSMNLRSIDNAAEHCMLLLPVDGGRDFCTLHYGAELARYSEDRTGGLSSSMPEPLGSFLVEQYRSVLARGRPRLLVSPALISSEVQTWERLILPIRAAENERLLIVLMSPLEMRQDILTAVFEVSDIAMFALRALRNEEDEVVDFRFVAANPAYCDIIGKGREAILHRPVSQAVPHYAENGLTAIFARVFRTGETARFEVDSHDCARPGTYATTVSRLPDGVAVTASFARPLAHGADHAQYDRPHGIAEPVVVD